MHRSLYCKIWHNILFIWSARSPFQILFPQKSNLDYNNAILTSHFALPHYSLSRGFTVKEGGLRNWLSSCFNITLQSSREVLFNSLWLRCNYAVKAQRQASWEAWWPWLLASRGNSCPPVRERVCPSVRLSASLQAHQKTMFVETSVVSSSVFFFIRFSAAVLDLIHFLIRTSLLIIKWKEP